MTTLVAIAFMRFSNLDISAGNDIKEVKAKTAEECEAKCVEIDTCKTYVLSERLRRCWLKDNLEGIELIDLDIVAGIRIKEDK